MTYFIIKTDDLSGQKIRALLQRHLDEMSAASPPESVHALDLDGLRAPNISFWSIWQDEQLLGCGALKQLDDGHAEIKSMHVHSNARGKGVAEKMLVHILTFAKSRRYYRVSLETGSMAQFAPARRLYEKYGFSQCPVFGDYQPDIHSICMTRSFGFAENILAKSDNFTLFHEHESVDLVKNGYAVGFEVGDHYGEPEMGIIAPDESWCLTLGEGVIIYEIGNPEWQNGQFWSIFRRQNWGPSIDIETPADEEWFKKFASQPYVAIVDMFLEPSGTVKVIVDPWSEIASTWRLDVKAKELSFVCKGPDLSELAFGPNTSSY